MITHSLDIQIILQVLGFLSIPICLHAAYGRFSQACFFLKGKNRQYQQLYRLAACDHIASGFVKLVLANTGIGILFHFGPTGWAAHVCLMVGAVLWSTIVSNAFYSYLSGEL